MVVVGVVVVEVLAEVVVVDVVGTVSVGISLDVAIVVEVDG